LLNTLICYNCGKVKWDNNEVYHSFELGRIGYGSKLDGCECNFILCDECMYNIISNFKLKDYIYNSGSNMNYDRLQKAYENHKVDVKKITAEDERAWEDDMIEHDN